MDKPSHRDRFWNAVDWCVRHWRELCAVIVAGTILGFVPRLAEVLTGDRCG